MSSTRNPMLQKLQAFGRRIRDIQNFVNGHELARRTVAASYWRVIRWQLASRLRSSPIEVPFVDDTVLLVTRGMLGATGNVYAGLHEFREMSFVLHFLREDDLFADVGANVGVYAVLASGVRRARTVAFEPIQNAIHSLQRNVDRNNIRDLVSVRDLALGFSRGVAYMVHDADTMNRVVQDDAHHNAIQVAVSTLADEFRADVPALIKIDAEGQDGEIVLGGFSLIEDQGVKALIVEFSGLGEREREAHEALKTIGFLPYTYAPFERVLVPLDAYTDRTIYVRDKSFVEERLRCAPAFRVLSYLI